MSSTRRRRLAIGLGALALVAALGAAAVATGLWQPTGMAVQIVESSTLFSEVIPGQRLGLLVCAPPQAWSAHGEAAEPIYLHIGPQTTLQDRRGRLLPGEARLEDLQAGQRLSIWHDGVMLSYPAQVIVEQLVIEEDGQGQAAACPLRGLEP